MQRIEYQNMYEKGKILIIMEGESTHGRNPLTTFFANKDFHKIQKMYDMPQNTMEKYLYREEYISQCVCSVQIMKEIDILNTISENFCSHIVKQLRITEGT